MSRDLGYFGVCNLVPLIDLDLDLDLEWLDLAFLSSLFPFSSFFDLFSAFSAASLRQTFFRCPLIPQ